MKKFLLFLTLLLPPLAIPTATVAIMSLSACKSPASAAYTSIAANKKLVSDTLADWAKYVVWDRSRILTLPSGSIQNDAAAKLASGEKAVQGALDRYNTAEVLALASLNGAAADAYPAPAPLLQAGQEFVAVVAAAKLNP